MMKTSIACYVGSLVIVSVTFGLKVGLVNQTPGKKLCYYCNMLSYSNSFPMQPRTPAGEVPAVLRLPYIHVYQYNDMLK